MLAERNLLNARLAGGSHLYVLTTIPDADLPRPSALFNHLIDELDKCFSLKPKVEKARESSRGLIGALQSGYGIVLTLPLNSINKRSSGKSSTGPSRVSPRF